MYLATANIWNGMDAAQRKSEAQKIFAELPTPGQTIVCWQELKIDSVEDRHVAIIEAEPTGTQHCFRNSPLGASVPTGKYEVMEETVTQTLPMVSVNYGKAYGDAARYFGTLKLRAKWRTTADKFYLINTHFPAGCMWDTDINTLTDAGQKQWVQEARDRWMVHYNLVRDEIHRIKNPDGTVDKTVMWTGDFNRGATMPQFYANEKQAFGANSIDKAYVIDRNIATTKISDGVIVLNYSDHNCKWVDWELT